MRCIWALVLVGCGYSPLARVPPEVDAALPDVLPDVDAAPSDAGPVVFRTVAPVKISADLSCTTDKPNTARKVAVDADGTIYAIMKCGSSAMVAISRDLGESFSAPSDLSKDLPEASVTVAELTVAAGPPGVAYVGMTLDSKKLYLRVTHDHGATWTAARLVNDAAGTTAGLSIQAFQDDVYVGYPSSSGGASVARNHHQGDGGFDVTPVATGDDMFLDLLYDPTRGSLVVTGDNPSVHLYISSDGGVSFGATIAPKCKQFYSDWALGAGRIFVVGTRGGTEEDPTHIGIIPTDAPSTVSLVPGLPDCMTVQTRSIAADAAGAAYVVSQLDNASLQLDRLAAAATTFDPPRSLTGAGTSPTVAPLPGNQGAAVTFTTGTAVWATVQTY